ncbi:MAG: NUDIX hydrolase [Candidatus Woesearchaeota archaeon]
MISEHKFKDFNPKFAVVGCFIEYDGEILLIKRHKDKDNGNKWAIPSGKVDPGETHIDAMVRETFEETGLRILPERLNFIDRSYVRFPKFDFTYTFYKYLLKSGKRPKIILNAKEHTEYMWMKPKDALNEDLMQDEDYCIKKAYNI